jgi:hypothetical protein
MLQNNIYGFIYKTTLPDGRYYIGQHKIISQNTLDPTYFGSGRIIRDYIKSKGKLGLKREILDYGYSFDEMNSLESKHVTEDVLTDVLNINLDRGGRSKYSRWPEVNARIGFSISKLRKEHPEKWHSLRGSENNKAANWKLISPIGEEFIICGSLNSFCKEHNISANTIKVAVRQGWIPKRGVCAGWQAFNLDTGKGTVRHTLNHGEFHSGKNNPWYKNK